MGRLLFNRSQTEPDQEQLNTLEQHLAGTLRPVHPSRDLLLRLRQRMRWPDRALIAERLQDWKRLFLVFGGVMSAMLVVLTVARALFHLTGRRNF
jgi:hypothetical protein